MSNANVIEMPRPRPDRETIAAPIRAHLAVKNMSGSELARRLDLTQPQISRRLNGRLPFTSDDLTAIAVELGVTVAELVQMPTLRPGTGGASEGRATDYGSGVSPVIDLTERIRPGDSDYEGELATVTEMWG